MSSTTDPSTTPPGSPPRKKNKQNPSSSSSSPHQPPPPPTNAYCGWVPPPTTTTVPTLDLASYLTTHKGVEGAAAAFFNEYIALRKPVLIKGHLPEAEWKGGVKWMEKGYLKEKAGGAMVTVETRKSKEEKFGQGHETRMPFAQFLAALEEEEGEEGEKLYLTTQELEIGPDDRPAVMSNPVTQLQGLFHPPTHPPTHPLTYSSTQLSMHPLTHPCIHSPIH